MYFISTLVTAMGWADNGFIMAWDCWQC